MDGRSELSHVSEKEMIARRNRHPIARQARRQDAHEELITVSTETHVLSRTAQLLTQVATRICVCTSRQALHAERVRRATFHAQRKHQKKKRKGKGTESK